MVIILITTIFVVLYSLKISAYFLALGKIDKYNPKPQTFNFDVIIPFRNEENNIPIMIEALSIQKSNSKLNVIFVNDHSLDNSVNILEKVNVNFSMKILHLEKKQEGKKEALKAGIKNSSGEYIIFLDCDAFPGEKWLKTIEENLSPETSLMCSPVIPLSKSFFGKVFVMPGFFSLMLCGGASIIEGRAVMCNGANMICRRKDFSDNLMNKKISSGDDIFILHNLKKQNKRIKFLNKKESAVYTMIPNSFVDFLAQRLRWGSKSIHYTDKAAIYLAVVVAITNIGIVLSFPFIFKQKSLLIWWVSIFLLKTTIDFLLLIKGEKKYNIGINWIFFLISEIFEVLNTSILSILSLFVKTKWKQRRIKL
jgi:cellulose synthase/poly-beta-1,6-N-acetylglucosamine synthase-like glycosyltransferase